MGEYAVYCQDTTNRPLLVFYRSHIEPGQASYMRGIQIVRSGISKEAVIAMHYNPVAEPREYASFIAWDFKNKVVRDISTALKAITNYFTKSKIRTAF